ncbi:MAG: 8-amino-7-oxononanoate synthase [Bacteroidales bacterium]|nr:8-amino-7-oxononanoate synthase [Bacteroidales bacterium]
MSRIKAYRRVLEGFAAESRLRTIPRNHNRSEWLDMTSNDYMGLSSMHEITDEFHKKQGNEYPSFSASASRLLSLDQTHHLDLESMLGSLYARPALLFNSGYHANTGIIAALNLPGTLFVADKLIHASMIDGLMMGRCEFVRFPHNDVQALERVLEREAPKRERIIILVESIYSMDGDMAPLRQLVAMRNKYPNVLLYVDEAHAFGVRGKRGLGLSEELGVTDSIDLLIGTLGKAACSCGAFVVADAIMINYIANCARSFIFSTALPPVNQAWSMHTIRALLEMEREREHLRELSVYFREKLRQAGYDVPEGDSPIVPLLTGDAAQALALSSRLRDAGILALPIRRPTVPPGGERIRFSLSAKLTTENIYHIIKAL